MDSVRWYERLFALLMIPLVCWNRDAAGKLWRLFRYGEVFEF